MIAFQLVRQAQFSDISGGLKLIYSFFKIWCLSCLPKLFRTVSRTCHCEAAELFDLLDDMHCFPRHAVSSWWACNQYRNHKSPSACTVVVLVSVPADGRHFTRRFTLLKKRLIIHSWVWSSKVVFVVWKLGPRESHTICHTDFFHYPAEWDVSVMTDLNQ